ncbi:MAG: 6,7-dimethyl-8-ribityllumazine synthase [Candidatus Aenigmarchaeota archaeon]|nr:6,7-dimethyl-8-ribityllumazine synthase [Candidatus Aenigmarchaeota archaeon]
MTITIGIVAATFHEEVMEKMLEEALERAEKLDVEVAQVYRCPGSFDIPLFVKKLLDAGVDGVATLGTLVTGETDHDQVIAFVAAEKLAALALEYGKPVALGITGPRQTYDQAVARIPRAGDIVEACVQMIRELRK